MMGETDEIQPLFSFLCEYIIEDLHGKKSFIGVFQTINVAEFPGGLKQFYAVTGIRAIGTEGKPLNLRLENEDRTWQQELASVVVKDAPEELTHASMVVFHWLIQDFDFPCPGNYNLTLLSAGRTIHQSPFEVKQKNAGSPKFSSRPVP